jgi:DNA-binding NtrC family response regulator
MPLLYVGRATESSMGQAFKPIALVVEDDPDQRDLLSVLLEEVEFHVFACESAEAALGILDKYGSAMSLVVTDVQLAGRMTGADLARVAKHRHPNLSVIVTSGSTEPALPSDTVFMPKPWRALDILREAERVH